MCTITVKQIDALTRLPQATVIVNAGDAMRPLIADDRHEARLLCDDVMGAGYL